MSKTDDKAAYKRGSESKPTPHKPMKVSAAMGGRPGRWVCSCGQSKTDAGWQQVWMVKASFKEHVNA